MSTEKSNMAAEAATKTAREDFDSLVAECERIIEERKRGKAALEKAVEDAKATLAEAEAQRDAATDPYEFSELSEKARKQADVLKFHERNANVFEKLPSKDEVKRKQAIIRRFAKGEADALRAKANELAVELLPHVEAFAAAMEEADRASTLLDIAAIGRRIDGAAFHAYTWPRYSRRAMTGHDAQQAMFCGKPKPDPVVEALWQLVDALATKK